MKHTRSDAKKTPRRSSAFAPVYPVFGAVAGAPFLTQWLRALVADHNLQAETVLRGLLEKNTDTGVIDPVLRSLFAVAITEMEEKGAPPVNVIINEYLDVAHGFFSGDEPKLVNGVLDAVAKRRAAAAQGVASSEEPKVEAELSEDGPVGHALTEAAAETDHSHDGQA